MPILVLLVFGVDVMVARAVGGGRRKEEEEVSVSLLVLCRVLPRGIG